MEVDRYAKMAASDSAQSAVISSANLAVKGVNWSKLSCFFTFCAF